MLKDKFGFAEHQEKTISGLGYKLIIKRNTDNVEIKKTQPTLVNTKLMLLNGMYNIIRSVLNSKLYYLIRL